MTAEKLQMYQSLVRKEIDISFYTDILYFMTRCLFWSLQPLQPLSSKRINLPASPILFCLLQFRSMGVTAAQRLFNDILHFV